MFSVRHDSHGTVVYRGTLQGRRGRAVAVKRLPPQDSVTHASREIKILQDSDGRPNVIQYYYQEAPSNFLYISLELCPATLADIIETPDRDAWRDISVAFDPKCALRQIISGLRHLHNLNLIHREIKPRNILVSPDGKRMLISEATLRCNARNVHVADYIRGHFCLGVFVLLQLTNGGHPFGDPFEGEANILKGALRGLERPGEEGEEAVDLVSSMLHAEAHERPDIITCLLHPFFWDPSERLNFLQDGSDRFELMSRHPKDPYLLALDKGSVSIVGNDWLSRVDLVFLENLGSCRRYDGRSDGV
ncbi:kinase-like domain-containing protein [Mycena galopus ATCC 62051]|nr:kinase-like domain-containing protein [Mycena galopus ATCC 62051]